ncbi:hypothetical protein C8E86_2395 [Catellatospora citrea]|nr:hypothetical protein C8E86_2395 [Catellatospora citrea]
MSGTPAARSPLAWPRAVDPVPQTAARRGRPRPAAPRPRPGHRAAALAGAPGCAVPRRAARLPAATSDPAVIAAGPGDLGRRAGSCLAVDPACRAAGGRAVGGSPSCRAASGDVTRSAPGIWFRVGYCNDSCALRCSTGCLHVGQAIG